MLDATACPAKLVSDVSPHAGSAVGRALASGGLGLSVALSRILKCALHGTDLLQMNAWMTQWFDETQQAKCGGIIRRSIDDVDEYATVGEVVAEARSRNWHVIETGDQVVVFCHDGDMRVHC